MKKRLALSLPGILLMVSAFASLSAMAHTQEQKEPPKVSEAEAKALEAFNAAMDPAAKVTTAEEFVKKYPKSPILPQLAEQTAIAITKVEDSNQKLALADRFQKTFTDASALTIVNGARLDALLKAKRNDEAFALGATILGKDPEELRTLVRLAYYGTEEAKTGNAKNVQQTQQYALKAIEIIEADRKPASMNEEAWTSHKAALPQLYQQTGILSMMMGDPKEAKVKLSKAIALNPSEPSSHAIMAYMINNEYLDQATKYKEMPEGKEKAELLPKLEAMIDSIIESYARTVALATGKPEYQGLLQQVMPDLTNYYKYRHNQSVEGLQELIDKYKTKP